MASGFGFSLLTAQPRNRIARNGKKLAYVRLENGIPPKRFGMVTVRTIRETRAVAAFKQHCRMNVSVSSVPGMTNL